MNQTAHQIEKNSVTDLATLKFWQTKTWRQIQLLVPAWGSDHINAEHLFMFIIHLQLKFWPVFTFRAAIIKLLCQIKVRFRVRVRVVVRMPLFAIALLNVSKIFQPVIMRHEANVVM